MYLDHATGCETGHATTDWPEREAHKRTAPIRPFVLCGGTGTRLWPLSRSCMPKQFIELVPGAPTTFQGTLSRVSDPRIFGPATVIASEDLRHVVSEQIALCGVGADVILEPQARDSCAAVAVAACLASKSAPDALVLVLSSDHVLEDAAAFSAACAAAASAARAGFIMTFGSVPTRPATEFGYILTGEVIESEEPSHGAVLVSRFTEKPDRERARKLVADGALWNTGCFLFRADILLAEMSRLAPALLDAVRLSIAGGTTCKNSVRLDANAFGKAPKLSFDHAIMERTSRAGVLPVSYAWSDIGSWDALWEATRKDGNGNALHGNVSVLDSRDSLVRSEGETLAAVVGVEGVVVVCTDDAVLVTTRERAGEVKDLVGLLRAGSGRHADDHRRMHRPWGWYQRTDVGARFQVKRIMVKPQGRLSLQKHHHRAEHWIVVSGTAEVTVDGTVSLVHENESVQLPIGCVHRLANPGKIPLELVEVQVGSYTGEDDIVRFDDDYGR